MVSYFYQPHILQPTRITEHSATLIDNIYFNSIEHNTISGNLLYDISDHLPNFLIINKHQYMYGANRYIRDYTHFNQSDLVDEVAAINWETVLPNADDVNIYFDSFYDKLTEIVDKHVPIKKISKRRAKLLSKPWITKAILKSIKVKNKFYTKYIKYRNDYYFSKYKAYRNKLKHVILLSKKAYYSNYFSINSNNIKNTWHGIRQLITLKNQNKQVPTIMEIGSKKVTNTFEIANAFNNYFGSVGPNLTNSIPFCNASYENYLKSPLQRSFVLYPTSSIEIEYEIDSLDKHKSIGPYSITIRLLKCLKLTLLEPLCHLYNCSFLSGVVPNKLKYANVIPVFKKGIPSDIANYRPISLLSVFNRILEKLMYNRLIKFWDKNKIFFEQQFGFRAKHSTTHAILLIIDKIQKAIEKKLYSCGIFLDLSKAFDTVDHKILLKKLEYYGIRGIVNDWFCSYFTNRTHSVVIGDINSNQHPLTCGVPQGSILGPLLFLIYINDFNNSAENVHFHLFADDSNLFFAHKSLQFLEEHLNEQLFLCASVAMCKQAFNKYRKIKFHNFSSSSEENSLYC